MFDLAAANATYSYPGPTDVRPGRHLTVITCMDSRIDVFEAFGLKVGDAHIIRNAGGIVTDDVLRSLAISQRVLGTREVVLVHHTRCGMLDFDDTAFRAELAELGEPTPPWDVPGFADVDDAVRVSVARVRACTWLPHRDDVAGFVFQVEDGRVRPVE